MAKNDLFNDDDPFGLPPLEAEKGANAPPEYTVSELSQKLKRTVEEEFSFVRVRGELSRITLAKSGHLYTDLKDAESVLNSICWKGTVSRLSVKPEEGMEVVCTGRLTTYPGRSNYQLIIETMELAGQGALLKMLEERKKKLAAEGLFDPARKRPIPYLPRVIGVITSPTGAVIRDIMHRLNERFPRRVLLWPVVVQGAGAAQAVSAAIAGFNSLPEGSEFRPDVLIVARGGGSLEDLMPFNDEAVVRAAANSKIPLISAVGHETDTTLIDFAADLRAPTPTAAAEKAVPVRTELIAQVMDDGKRLFVSVQRLMQRQQIHVQGLARGLTDPRRVLENLAQKLDHLSSRLDKGLAVWLERKASLVRDLGRGLGDPRRILESMAQKIEHISSRLDKSITAALERKSSRIKEIAANISARSLLKNISDTQKILNSLGERLHNTEKRMLNDRHKSLLNMSSMLESLSFKRVLERGYTVIKDEQGQIVSSAAAVKKDQPLNIIFRDGEKKVLAKE